MSGYRSNWPFWLVFLLMAWMGTASAAGTKENPIKIKASVTGGFDDNAGLNSARQEDFFTQESASVLYKKILNAKSQMRLTYNALNVNYFDATDQNILLNRVGAGLDILLSPSTMWENDYAFEYLDFTRNEAVTQHNNEFRTGLLQKLGKRMNAGAGFSVKGYQYENKKTRFGDGSFSLDDERSDLRYSADAKINYKLNPQVVLNLGTVIYWNDSDDEFNDYYDHTSYKFFGGFTWKISPKWVSFCKFSYERREYDSRPKLDSSDVTQIDDSFVANASLFYQIDSHLSVGTTYVYRQKTSNEPSQEYSGALGTLGLYYSF